MITQLKSKPLGCRFLITIKPRPFGAETQLFAIDFTNTIIETFEIHLQLS